MSETLMCSSLEVIQISRSFFYEVFRVSSRIGSNRFSMLFPPYDAMWSLSSGLVKLDLIIWCSLEDTACGYRAHHTFSHRKRHRRTEKKWLCKGKLGISDLLDLNSYSGSAINSFQIN